MYQLKYVNKTLKKDIKMVMIILCLVGAILDAFVFNLLSASYSIFMISKNYLSYSKHMLINIIEKLCKILPIIKSKVKIVY